MDSSVDVCDLMINLLCTECPDRACAENDRGEPIWSHSKLMSCIRKPIHEVDIHIRRTVPKPRCKSFEPTGDIPAGYPHACCNCSYAGDKEKCPYEPIIQIRTIKLGNMTGRGVYHVTQASNESFSEEVDEWTVTNIIGRREAPA